MTGYYDLVLGLIPLALAGISGVLTVAGMALTVAIPVAGLVSIALIGHAMFVRTPSTPKPPVATRTEAPPVNSAD